MAEPLTSDDPRELGSYELVGRLGAGGMGVVYLGRTQQGEPVAIKVIQSAHARDPDFRTRFRRELAVTRRVSGYFIAHVLDADLDADPPYFVTEFIPGDTLHDRVERQGPMRGDGLFALAAGVATGLAEMHELGVAHRDIKPTNVVLSPEGPKIVDLGIAQTPDATRITRPGMTMGTPAWMSPEHARGGHIGMRTDVFAWASLVYYAATGSPPFGTGRSEAVLYRVVHEEADTSQIDPSLRVLLDEALRKEPADRPTALRLAAELTDAEPDLATTRAIAATMLKRAQLAQTVPTPLARLRRDGPEMT